MPNDDMTGRQMRIYEYIRSQIKSRGIPPTVREICEAVGLKSPSSVHFQLTQLEQKGYIRRDLSKSRSIELLERQEDGPIAANVSQIPSCMVRLPLLGRVSAGQPLLAEGNVEEYVTLPHCLVGDDASFVLKVKGESMLGAGILNGDYVVVREQQQAANGEIVVALIGDEATVKTFYREPDRVRLQPENPTMEPIYSTNPRILGRVVALVRTM